MNNFNSYNTPNNFNFNNMRGFPGNNNNMMGGFSGNNSFMEPPFQNNNWGSNTGRGDFWSTMNNDRPGSSSLPGLLERFSRLSNSLMPFDNSGGRGRDSTARRSNSRYSPPPRSHNSQRDQSRRQAPTRARRSSNDRGRGGSAPTPRRWRDGFSPPRTSTGVPVKTRLSGAGKRRFLRYLQQGYSPEKARQKALEGSRPQTQAQAKGSTNLKKPSTSSDRKKAKPDPKKKPAIDSTKPKFLMAVMPVDYPNNVIQQEDGFKLEAAIVDEIAKGWEIQPEFHGLYFKGGCLKITCMNEATAKWLEERVPHLENWQGVPLKACSNEAVPQMYTLSISLPNSAGQEVEKTKSLLSAQNKDINISSWRVLKHKDEGKSQFLLFIIDDESVEPISKKKNSLNYRLGQVKVIVQATNKRKPKGEVLNADQKGDADKQGAIKTEKNSLDEEEQSQNVQVKEEMEVNTTETEQEHEDVEPMEEGAEDEGDEDEAEGEDQDYDDDQEL